MRYVNSYNQASANRNAWCLEQVYFQFTWFRQHHFYNTSFGQASTFSSHKMSWATMKNMFVEAWLCIEYRTMNNNQMKTMVSQNMESSVKFLQIEYIPTCCQWKIKEFSLKQFTYSNSCKVLFQETTNLLMLCINNTFNFHWTTWKKFLTASS